MNRQISILLVAAIFIAFAVGCKTEHDQEHVHASSSIEPNDSEEHNHDHEIPNENEHDHDHASSEVVCLDTEQQARVGIVLGEVRIVKNSKEMLKFPARLASTIDGAAIVGSTVAGRITELSAIVGQNVSKGQILARIQSPEGAEKVSEFIRTQANFKASKADVERATKLYDEKIGSLRDLQAKQSEFETSRAEFLAASHAISALGLTEKNIDDIDKGFPIFAPIAGNISQMNATLGQHIETGQDIFRIVDNNKLQVHLDIFENDIPKIALGNDAIIKLASSGEKISGKVISIGREMDIHKKTFPVIVSITRSKMSGVYVGMSAEVFIESNVTSASAFRVPDEAVILTESGYRVFVKENENTFEPREVEILAHEEHSMFLRGELHDGEIIAVKGGFFLQSQAMKSTIVDACSH